MVTFFNFEERVVRSLVAAKLQPIAIQSVLRDSTLERVETFNGGYRVVVHHPDIQIKRSMVYDFPYVIGQYEDTRARFTVNVGPGVLTLECRSLDGTPIPDYFRKRQVQIDVTNFAAH